MASSSWKKVVSLASKKKSKPVTSSGKFKKRIPKYEIPDPERDWYTPADLRGKDIGELKKLYTELRDISQKRLKRLNAKYPDADVLTYRPSSFPTIKQLKEESGGSKRKFAKDLRHSLSDLSRFVQSPYTTLTGQKEIAKSRVDILREHGFFKVEDDDGNTVDLLSTLSEEELKGVMKFVHWVQKTQHLNIMYRDEFAQKIKQDRFRQAVRRTGYGKGRDYGRKNYGRWYEEITGLKPTPVKRQKGKASNSVKKQSSSDFEDLR